MKTQELKKLSESMVAHAKILAACGKPDFARHFAELASLIQAANDQKETIH